MVYAAERWMQLQQPDRALHELQEADEQLLQLRALAGPELTATLRQLQATMAEVRGSLKTTPTTSASQLEALGEHLNLMLLKGELVLAEVRFPAGKRW